MDSSPVDFLFRIAQEHRKAGEIDEAIHELRKALLINPEHEGARRELATLESLKRSVREQAMEETLEQTKRTLGMRDQLLIDALNRSGAPAAGSPLAPPAPSGGQGLPSVETAQGPPADEPASAAPISPAAGSGGPSVSAPRGTEPPPFGKPPPGGPPSPEGGRPESAHGMVRTINDAIAPLKISGEVRSAAGVTGDDVIVESANGDLNERNFRIFSGPFRYNTFDPRIFSRFRLNIDTAEDYGWQLHSNTTVDPWSFVGTTNRVTVVGSTPTDQVDLQLKWWAATNTAINETFLSANNGDSLATPEVETKDGRTVPTSVTSVFSNTFQIPSLEIDYTFQPVRWFWTGYRSEMVDLRIFPLALEDQAMSSDDPLQLSNHHIYWEPSPWLDEWRAGHVNTNGASADDVARGTWSDDLSFFTRDSDLTRLTALRGTSLQFHPFDSTTLQAAMASPKGLWQPYDTVNSVVGMTRLKQGFFGERLAVGGLYTSRWGFNEHSRDATNHVFSLDGSVTPMDGTTLSAQAAMSRSIQDRHNLTENNFTGWAWHGAIKNAWWGERLTSRLFYTHMDRAFDPGLANYRNTRRDQFWGRHLKLKPRLHVLAEVRPKGALTWDDIEAVRIGDGVDIGREALGLRLSGSWWNHRLEPLIDVRRVHSTEGKYIETVLRNENTLHPISWLTAKTLMIYHDLPKTHAGIDPFLVNADTDRPYDNTAIIDDRDPSLQTYSLGASLAPVEQFSVWAAWERTNDTTVATDNFPRGLLDGTSFGTRTEEGTLIRFPTNFVYGQGFFPQPPYPFFDIYRAGAYYTPWKPIEFAVDWTRNEFEMAGQIDDNLNHVGLTTAWTPMRRLVLVAKYVASWAIDIADVNASGGGKFRPHHNAFGWLVWKVSDDSELSLEYGVSALGAPDILFSIDPEGDYYPTLDTEHLVRVTYANRF